MQQTKSGHVKFFSSQKGYGFIIPTVPIDGHSEVFVHHTVIHNSGGFKSLAESEPVEFEFTRGPKGLQATRVTGPGGAFVRGDPYVHPRARPPPAAAATPGIVTSTPTSAPGPFHHYPPPVGYARGFPYGSQPVHAAYGAPLASPVPLLGMPGIGIPATRPAIGVGGPVMMPAGTAADLHHGPAMIQQGYSPLSMPVPAKYHELPAAPSAFGAFNRYPQNRPYEGGIPASFASSAAGGGPQASLSAPPPLPPLGLSVPHFLIHVPPGAGALRTGAPAMADVPK
ncbi:hypothetical protein H4R19_000954 [Coemansia spiralis]|nr:hypothetical protein H4R19_000954 [Coemansia spiralis]